MIVTINIDDNTHEKDISLGFKLINDESKFFSINNFKKLYCKKSNENNCLFFVDIQNPANKDDVCAFEITEKTAQLIYDQLKNFLPKSLFNKIVSQNNQVECKK